MAGTVAKASAPGPVLIGRAGAPGVGVGRGLLVEWQAGPRPPAVDMALDAAAEADRLRAALETAASELTELAEHTSKRAGEEVGAIFVAQSLFARDPGIVEPTLAQIAIGVPAADAILAVTSEHADKLASVDDEYFRERAADVRDIGRRVAGLLRGDRRSDLWHPDGHPAVLVAVDLDPSAIATLRRELVAGIALAGGTGTGHAAIVARALGIPLVLGLGRATEEIPAGVEVAVDGSNGRVLVAPDPDAIAALESEPPMADLAPEMPIGTGDALAGGIRVAANIGSPLEAAAAVAAGADGVGLVRTELLFLGRHAPPSVDEQRATYSLIRAKFGDRPIVFRTLDVGGDKPAPWQTGTPEANPALGVRGVRLGQREPVLLDHQLRALVEAAGDGDLRIMLPMVAAPEELDAVRARLDAVVDGTARGSGVRPSRVQLGVMIEVPSAAIMADALAESADFFSIGTNDLVQYTLAADRTNPELADLASALQPAVLRLIDSVVRAAATHGRHVSVCGEAAGDPSVIPLLIGLGIDELSVAPAAISSVRGTVALLDRSACTALATRALRARTVSEVRSLMAAHD